MLCRKVLSPTALWSLRYGSSADINVQTAYALSSLAYNCPSFSLDVPIMVRKRFMVGQRLARLQQTALQSVSMTGLTIGQIQQMGRACLRTKHAAQRDWLHGPLCGLSISISHDPASCQLYLMSCICECGEGSEGPSREPGLGAKL